MDPNSIPDSSWGLLIAVFTLLVIGWGLLLWGRKIPRQGDWLSGLALVGLGGALGFGAAEWIKRGYQKLFWSRGWFWPPGEKGAITVGLLEDGMSWIVPGIATVISAAVLCNRQLLAAQPRTERIHASTLISVAGVALAWGAMTPWLALAGIAIALCGGAASLACRWDEEKEAALVTRLIGERFGGLMIAAIGVCGLVVARSDGEWLLNSEWNSIGDDFGAALLLAGLYIQFQPFPLMGWTVAETRALPLVRVVFAQLFPAMAAFSLLFRMENQLRSIGILPVLAWLLAVSALLNILGGLVQKRFLPAIGTWVSAGFSLSVVLLEFSGPAPAMASFIGCALGSFVLAWRVSFEGQMTSEAGACESPESRLGGWAKAAGFLAVAGATGFLGFGSALGFRQWISQAWEIPGLLAFFSILFLLYGALGWRLAWRQFQQKNISKHLSGWGIASALGVSLLGLGVIWNGTITGMRGIGPFAAPDAVLPSILAFLFEGAGLLNSSSQEVDALMDWVFSLSALVTCGAGLWAATRLSRLLESDAKLLAWFHRRMASGFGLDHALGNLLKVLSGSGSFLEKWVDGRFWKEWIPLGVALSIQKAAQVSARVDQLMSDRLVILLRKCVDLPVRGLQLLHNGDVRWYLFFAVGSGIAMLVHFSMLHS